MLNFLNKYSHQLVQKFYFSIRTYFFYFITQLLFKNIYVYISKKVLKNIFAHEIVIVYIYMITVVTI